MDENLFNENMEVIKKCLPGLYQRLSATKLGEKYMVMDNGLAGGQGYNLYCKDSKSFLYALDSYADAKKQVDNLKIKNARAAVFWGIGLGYELSYFITECQANNRSEYILIIEKSLEVFKWSLYFFNYTLFIEMDRIKLLIEVDEDMLLPELTEHLKTGMQHYLKTIKNIYHENAWRADKEYYEKVLKLMKSAVWHALISFGNDPGDCLIGIKNTMLNLNEILENPGVNLLYDKFKGKPGIVVATGPSLDKNKHLLKGLEDKALIIAADASLRILLPMGVKPHIVTSLERQEKTSQLFEGLDENLVQDTYLAACPVVPPLTYELYKGPRMIAYRTFEYFKWLETERGEFPIGPSSGNMAFELCQLFGCDPIILVGQDLAYAEDENVSHASGHFYGKNYEANRGEKILVKGNNGKMVKTHRVWNFFRNYYEQDIAKYDGLCINSTEGGAHIEGSVCMPLQDTIDKYIQEDINPREIIKNALKSFDQKDFAKERERVRQYARQSSDDLVYMRDILKKAIEEVDEKKREYGSINEITDLMKETVELEKNMNKVLKTLEKKEKTFHAFFNHLLMSYYIHKMNEIYELNDKDDEPKKILLQQLDAYRDIFVAAIDVIKALEIDVIDVVLS